MNHGGPAFPRVTKETCDDGLGNTVLVTSKAWRPGMSLRDWFAGQALAGLCTKPHQDAVSHPKQAYEVADAMLAAREKGGSE